MAGMHVVFPIENFIEVGSRFDGVGQFLQAHSATLHLVVELWPLPEVYSDFDAIPEQRRAVQKRQRGYKKDMMQRIRSAMQRRFPELQINLHITEDPLPFAVDAITRQYGVQLMLLDQAWLLRCAEMGIGRLQQLTEHAQLPVWVIGEATPASGLTVAALDVMAPSSAEDRLSKSMVVLAQHIAGLHQSEVTLTHCWQLNAEPFINQWLEINQLDTGRYARFEKQKIADQLRAISAHYAHTGVAVHTHVSEGMPERAIPSLCRTRQARLLVMGQTRPHEDAPAWKALDVIRGVDCDVVLLPHSNTPLALVNSVMELSHFQQHQWQQKQA